MTSTVEDYLKQLAIIELEQNQAMISMKRIGEAVGVTPGTATSMIKRLEAQGLVEYRHHQGCSLTDQGRRAGLKTLRRHRLVELFLVKTLGMDWNEVHGEAELIEHSISPTVAERFDRFLGYPERDPHGEPIPSAEGFLPAETAAVPLAVCKPGSRVRIYSVNDRDRGLLSYLAEHGLRPDIALHIGSVSPASGIITLFPDFPDSPSTDARELGIPLSLEQARLIQVLTNFY